jgi:hypothetical protein
VVAQDPGSVLRGGRDSKALKQILSMCQLYSNAFYKKNGTEYILIAPVAVKKVWFFF